MSCINSTAQHLAAIGLNLMRIGADAAGGAQTLDILDEIEGSLQEAAKELRAFTYLLHPPDLQREELSAALGRYVEGFGTRTGLKITLKSCRRVDQLSPPLQQTLLRIVQEALTNVYRHASATCVSVNFRCVGKRLRLVISDDGQGTVETSGRQNGTAFRLGNRHPRDDRTDAAIRRQSCRSFWPQRHSGSCDNARPLTHCLLLYGVEPSERHAVSSNP